MHKILLYSKNYQNNLIITLNKITTIIPAATITATVSVIALMIVSITRPLTKTK